HAYRAYFSLMLLFEMHGSFNGEEVERVDFTVDAAALHRHGFRVNINFGGIRNLFNTYIYFHGAILQQTYRKKPCPAAISTVKFKPAKKIAKSCLKFVDLSVRKFFIF
ncbi:MAG: hypothetical protein ACD_39C01363G0001, partial [uncultured bacterium]